MSPRSRLDQRQVIATRHPVAIDRVEEDLRRAQDVRLARAHSTTSSPVVPRPVTGIRRYDSVPISRNSQIIWEDLDIALVAADGVTGAVIDRCRPAWSGHALGGNRASQTLAASTSRSFSAGLDLRDDRRSSRHFNLHRAPRRRTCPLARVSMAFSSATHRRKRGGRENRLRYCVGDIIHAFGPTRSATTQTASANTIHTRLTLQAEMMYLAKRPPDQIFARVPARSNWLPELYIPANTPINIPAAMRSSRGGRGDARERHLLEAELLEDSA